MNDIKQIKDKEDFAKTFADNAVGQILVLKDKSSDNGDPCVSIKFFCEEINEFYTAEFKFERTADGLSEREKFFGDMIKDGAATAYVADLLNNGLGERH